MPQSFVLPIPTGLDRPGLQTRDLTFETQHAVIDPFLVISLFEMSQPAFPPHPHAGFSVATYIFPESDTGFWNQDSLGNVNPIPPGALHLTVAGSGVLHEETVARSGRAARGLQIWIDHADADRLVAPRAHHVAAADVPRTTAHGVTRATLLDPDTAPVQARIVDVEMTPGSTLRETVPDGATGFALIRAGDLDTPHGRAGPATVVLAAEGCLDLTALAPTRLTIFGGTPLRHEIVASGPFVASTKAQARKFRDDYAAGAMGHLAPFAQSRLDRNFDTPNEHDGSLP